MPADSQFDREKALFVRAVELPPGEERLRYLKDACGEDAALSERVQALLWAHEEAAIGFLPKQPPGGGASLIGAVTEKPGDRLGRYKLLQRIGEGGYGVVYMAEQEEPVRRRVALKVIKLGMDTRSVVARFEAERQALAIMDHPNIARVLDAGATETGRPFFVMELVRGIRLTEYCDQNNLSTAERLHLFSQVCQAVQHAHQKGVIHRDLKPSNVLVTLHDGMAVPKIIDFGIAKATEGRLTDKTPFTEFQSFIGTPAYTSPEQAEMSGLDIDTRTDIYSLGVLLYELLAGKTPFDSKELLAAGLDEMRRTIREKEPVRPSTRLSTMFAADLTAVAKHRQTDALRLIHLLRGDLDWIVMKCLEKDRRRRYDTANALATDIQHHLNNEPVVARPQSAAYRLQKLVRRNKLAFAAGAAVTAALILGLAVSTTMFFKERRAYEGMTAAEREQRRLRAQAETARATEQQLRQRAEAGEKNARYLAYVANINLAQQAWDRNEMEALQRILEETKDYPDKGFEWYYWQRQAHQAIQTIFLADHDPWCMFFSPDGQRVATGGRLAKVRDTATGRIVVPTLAGYRGWISAVAFSPDGRRILTGSADGTARIWDASTGQQLQTLIGHTHGVRAAVFSPDGRRIATSSEDQTARVWEAASGQELRSFKGHEGFAQAVAFSRDGQRVLTASYDGTVKVWDASEDLLQAKWRQDETSRVKFSPDGRCIVTANRSNYTASVWDAASGRQLLTLRGHADVIGDATFSSDSRRIVTGSKDKTAIVWDAGSGRMLHTLKGHRGSVNAVAFSRDGQRIVTASSDQTGRVWDASSGQELQILSGHTGSVHVTAFSADGLRIITCSFDKTAKVWDAVSGKEVLTLNGHAYWISSAGFSPDGLRIVICSSDKTARVWDAVSGQELLIFKGRKANAVSFSPDGKRIITGYGDIAVRLWDAVSGRELLTLAHNENWGRTASVAFTADGRRILASSFGRAAVFETASPEQVASWQKEEQAVAEAVAAFEREHKMFYEADSLHRKRQFAEAEPLYRQLLKNRRQRLASDDPAVLEMTADLGCVLYSQALDERLGGNEAKASEYNREADELLNQLLTQINPNDSARWRAAAEAFARRRHWKAAASCFARLADGNVVRAQDRLLFGLVLLETGDLRAYEQLRQKTLAEVAETDHPVIASTIARLCCLRPLPQADAVAAAALGEKAITLGREYTSTNWFVFAKGLVEYRQGNHSNAVELLQTLPVEPEYSPLVAAVQAVLAMNHFQMSRSPEARASLARCATQTKKYGLEAKRDDLFENWAEWLLVHLLQREATELIEGQPALGAPANSAP